MCACLTCDFSEGPKATAFSLSLFTFRLRHFEELFYILHEKPARDKENEMINNARATHLSPSPYLAAYERFSHRKPDQPSLSVSALSKNTTTLLFCQRENIRKSSWRWAPALAIYNFLVTKSEWWWRLIVSIFLFLSLLCTFLNDTVGATGDDNVTFHLVKMQSVVCSFWENSPRFITITVSSRIKFHRQSFFFLFLK